MAHAWSGYPVTAAAHRVGRRIGQLVYWSAFVPLPGESMLDAIPGDDREALSAAAEAGGGDSVLIPVPRWQTRFVQTAPLAVQELTYGLLRPIPWSLLSQSLSPREAAIPNLPVSYLVGAQDLSLPEGEEWWATKYAPRLGVEPIAFDGMPFRLLHDADSACRDVDDGRARGTGAGAVAGEPPPACTRRSSRRAGGEVPGGPGAFYPPDSVRTARSCWHAHRSLAGAERLRHRHRLRLSVASMHRRVSRGRQIHENSR